MPIKLEIAILNIDVYSVPESEWKLKRNLTSSWKKEAYILIKESI